jgi:hypothetical protein
MANGNFMPIYLIILILVGFSSFGLGRLSMIDKVYPDSIKSTSVVSNEEKSLRNYSTVKQKQSQGTNISKEGNYVASKNGKLYYSASCKGANRIKEENKVWFDTASDAEKSGYSPSTSCK